MIRWLTVCLLVLSAGIAVGQLEFDGTGDYVDLGDNDGWSFGDGTNDYPFTFSAWVNMADATDFSIFQKFDGSPNPEYDFVLNSSDLLALALYDASGSVYEFARTDEPLTAYEGVWTHVSATYDGRGGEEAQNGISLYVNGIEVSITNLDAGTYVAMHNTSTPLYLGSRYFLPIFADGQISDPRIYNRALTASEVQTLYEYGLNPTANQRAVDYIAIATGTNALVFSGSCPVGYRGGDAVTNLTTYYDQSPNSNHGTIYGTPTISETPWQGTAP